MHVSYFNVQVVDISELEMDNKLVKKITVHDATGNHDIWLHTKNRRSFQTIKNQEELQEV